MPSMPREYRRTEAGRHVWDTRDEAVSIEYRRVLGLIGAGTDVKRLRARLGWSEAAVTNILEELEELGMVESIAPDLDFTGTLLAEDLDFTGSLSIAALRAELAKKGE